MSNTIASDNSDAQPIAGTVGMPPDYTPQAYNVSEGGLFHPNTGDVRPQPGFNPRDFFCPIEHKSLTASVAAQGVFQAIIVRPDPDDPNKFVIVVGERRWRATVSAGLETIPAIFRDIDDRLALAIASAENYERASVSPAEEAKLARRMLDACDGDRETARKELSWPRSLFDSRLALNHCTDAVLKALAERKIRVGHAELLATLPAETQEGTLTKVLDEQISVADLKAKLATFTQLLSAAIFDKAKCACCPHNSSLQASLFEETLGEGHCANRACFAAKTTEALRQKESQLGEEYNCVFLDLDRSPETWTPLCKSGSTGVGAEQYSACQGCQHFGALVSSKPGEEGQVERDICFDLPCNTKRVAEQRERTKDANGNESNSDANGTGTRANGTSGGKGKTPTKGAATASRPPKVEDAVDRFLRATASDAVKGDLKMAKALALFALLQDAKFPTLNVDGLEPFYVKPCARSTAVKQCYKPDETALDQYLVAAACHLIGETPDAAVRGPKELVITAAQVLRVTGVELAGKFKLNEAFLRTHTKAGISSLLQEPLTNGEASFVSRFDKKFGKGAFAKLMKQKTDKIVTRILGAGFDLTRFVPRCVSERLQPKSK